MKPVCYFAVHYMAAYCLAEGVDLAGFARERFAGAGFVVALRPAIAEPVHEGRERTGSKIEGKTLRK